MVKRIAGVLILTSAIALVGCGQREVSYAKDIRPILEKSCIECHNATGEGQLASALSLLAYEDLMKGTQFGPVVVPGSSMSSALYLVVAGKTDPEIRMPPHHAESWAQGRGVPLTDEQIATIARWIDEGAKNN